MYNFDPSPFCCNFKMWKWIWSFPVLNVALVGLGACSNEKCVHLIGYLKKWSLLQIIWGGIERSLYINMHSPLYGDVLMQTRPKSQFLLFYMNYKNYNSKLTKEMQHLVVPASILQGGVLHNNHTLRKAFYHSYTLILLPVQWT